MDNIRTDVNNRDVNTDTWIRNEQMDDGLMRTMQIRYIKLHFELEILEDGLLPKTKASMLRGGMGRMLLMMNCISDEECDLCDFKDECIVPRMMYARMKIRPSFMTQKDSEGYVLECEDSKESFRAGDRLFFNLLLFGDSIVYFNQFLQAFHALGQQGLGTEHIRFRIRRITNTTRDLLLEGGAFYKENYRIMRIWDYVNHRVHSLKEGQDILLIFRSPLSLKYQGNFQNSLDPLPLLTAIERRLYILNCYEGLKEGDDYVRIPVQEHLPQKIDEKIYLERVKRYSGTQDRKIVFSGIKGSCRLSRLDHTAMALLSAGELIHIGKNTSFGFGRYTLVSKSSS